MQRRDVLRLLATGAALQLAPHGWLQLASTARAMVAETPSLRTLNAHQKATVNLMADLMIPRTETPSASDVGVSRFIDLILTEWYEASERDHFLTGLAAVDSRTRDLFGKNFVECSPEQQKEMLIELGAKMIEDSPPAATHRSFVGPVPPPPNFYADFRRLTLTAYYTSEAGDTKELQFEIIPGDYHGCDISSEPKEAAKQP